MTTAAATFVPGPGDALLVVDVQNDFLPGGALGVPDGDEVIPVANRYVATFARAGCPVIFSRDWHPAEHCSFAAAGGPWPSHCVQNTPGAAFSDELERPADAVVISKATRREAEAYSAFDGTDLGERLAAAGVKRLLILGLATDYCVQASALDALAAGLEVIVPTAGVRAVNVEAGDGDRALARMRSAGAALIDG
jgi:nicotinamidase/pyrazinamidase